MACPTCSATLNAVVRTATAEFFFHCPRCGTLQVGDKVYVPALIERCRKFGDTLGPEWAKLWHRLGIAEAINLPEARPA